LEKTVLVTGGAQGIGRATALLLAGRGYRVAVADIRKSELFFVKTDVSREPSVRACVRAVVKRFGRLDILVLNASQRKETPFIDMSFEEWRSLISITLDGSFHCVKACLPHLMKAGGGSIVTIGGMTALSGAKRRVHGSVGKHGLYGMTRALAKELGEHQINVNCVAPGQMNTPRAAGRAEREGATGVPMGRRVEPAEIATISRFLCGPGGRMVSGQLIYVDGGQQQF